MMKNKVLKYIKENKMIKTGEAVVAGVSGGADSMCLLHILADIRKELNIKLAAVHIHHGVRGDTADRDARFVEEYCKKEDIQFYLYKRDVPTLAKKWGMSCEEAGRKVRYDAFSQVVELMGGQGKIAVAHNADDLAETVLLNLFRGTGIKGLAGIQPVRGNIIRPILCLTRKEVEEYDSSNNLDYVTDETNLTDEYTRNKIRLDILPAIRAGVNERVAEHINNTALSLALIDDYMEKEADRLFENIVIKRAGGIFIKESEFKRLHMAMKWQVAKKCLYDLSGKMKDITRNHMEGLVNVFDMQVGKRVNLPYGMTAIREYEGVLLTDRYKSSEEKKSDKPIVYIKEPGQYIYEDSGIRKKIIVKKDEYNDAIFSENNCTKWVDCDIIGSDLQFRTRRPGDYIIVDDSGSKKKLKDFLIDRKIPRKERDKILLVANGSEIIWIIGVRLSSAYKVRENTKNILRLEIMMED